MRNTPIQQSASNAGNRRGLQSPAQLRALETAVAAAFGISPAELRAASRRSATAALARQTAMYLAHVSLQLNFTQAGALFGRDRTTAAHACRLVESRRDDPAVDRLLLAIEHVCVAAP